jgi:glycerol-3-phosphate dehydrogenase subunit B
MFDDPEFRIQVVAALKRKLASRNGVHLSRIGFPAVLGLDRPLEAKRDLEEKLGLPVFEIPTIPASIPGIRLSKLLIREIERNGGRVFDGMEVTSCESAEGRITNMRSEAAVRTRSNRARNFVLATGGILGGDVVAEYNGSAHEVACGLPLHFPTSREDWLRRDFLTPAGHPIYRSGIFVNKDFQPVNHHGQVLYDNLWAVGTGLAYGEYLRERSFDGIGLATGYAVGASISKDENPSK